MNPGIKSHISNLKTLQDGNEYPWIRFWVLSIPKPKTTIHTDPKPNMHRFWIPITNQIGFKYPFRYPGHATSVPEAIASFSDKVLNVTDMLLLPGAHTVGFAHCSFIEYVFSNLRTLADLIHLRILS